MMRKAIILAAFFCAACSNYSANLPSIKPYKMDIQQGNVVTSKMMMQLRPGMTKSQVRFIMGTPLIADSFHANRWDYIYRMQKDGKLIEQRHVILDFENDQLKGVRGDVIPAGTGEAVPAAKKDKSVIDKMKFWKGDEAEAPAKLESAPALTEPKPAPAKTEEARPAPAPKPVAEPKPETQPEAEKAPAPAAAPQPAKPEPKPEPVEKPAAEAKPSAKPAEPAKVEPKPVPQPADDLPPEDDPGYFERMLEKIGF